MARNPIDTDQPPPDTSGRDDANRDVPAGHDRGPADAANPVAPAPSALDARRRARRRGAQHGGPSLGGGARRR
jgi:hypothetical protein